MVSELVNPYHPGQPVENRASFFGRDDTLFWIEQQLMFERRLLIVHGPALIGKTSLARNLPSTLEAHLPCLHFECKPYHGAVLNEVLVGLSAHLQQQLTARGVNLDWGSQIDTDPLDRVVWLLQQAATALNGQRLLLVLDDVHELDSGVTGLTLSSFFDVLAGWLAAVPALRLLVTLSSTALGELIHPLRAGAEVHRLGPLSGDAAQQLITRPVQGIVRFDTGVVKRIADITSNHPYYLHLVCQVLFDRCARDGLATQADVDAVLDELLSSPNPGFQALWRASSPPERAAMAAINGLKAAHGLVTQQEVVNYARRFDPQASQRLLSEALNSLVEREILVRMGASSYRFAVTLFRYWIERHFDPASVLTRVDWERLSSTSTSPAGAPAETKSRWGIGHWVIAALSLTALLGLTAWALILSGTWQPWATPTPDALPTSRHGGAVSPLPTPTRTPVPLTPTPTNPVVITRGLPAIAFRARSVGGKGDLPNWQIFVMDLDGSNRQRITRDANDAIMPAWSPDGQHIVFASKIDDNRDVFVINLDGTGLLNLTNHPANDYTPSWSPDGRQVIFSSNRLGYWEMFLVNSDGTDVRRIADEAIGGQSPVFSPDGKLIAFSARDEENNWDIYIMPAPGSTSQTQPPRRLTTAAGNDLAPMFSPRGDRIAFESNRDGNYEVYVMTIDGGNQRNLTNLASANDQGPVWSPDGKRIMFYSTRDGNWDIFVMSDTGRNVVNLTNTPDIDEMEPSWRP